MKNKIRIRAGILAIYILSLPVVLFFHSQTHSRGSATIVKSDFDDVIAQDDSDCQICSFYFDQQLYVEISVVSQLETFSNYFHQTFVASTILLPQEQQFLRGPPVV